MNACSLCGPKGEDQDDPNKKLHGEIFHEPCLLGRTRRVTNFAGSKIEWRLASLKGELQEVIRNHKDVRSNLTSLVQFGIEIMISATTT